MPDLQPLTGPAELLKPALHQTATGFKAILGQEDHGVIGIGDTPEAAINDWNEKLRDYLAAADPEDYIVTYVEHVLHSLPKPKHVTDFMSQFRAVIR